MQQTFGDVIFRRRKSLNLTQEALAVQVGVQPTYIGYLERGKRRPSPLITSKLAEALGLNRSHLFLLANQHVKDFLSMDEGENGGALEHPLPQAYIDLEGDTALQAMHHITPSEAGDPQAPLLPG